MFKSLFFFGWELFKELVFDVFELSLKSFGDLVLSVPFFSCALFELGLALVYFEILFTAELALEHGLHDFFFFWLERLVPERSAERHHADGTVAVADGSHTSHY